MSQFVDFFDSRQRSLTGNRDRGRASSDFLVVRGCHAANNQRSDGVNRVAQGCVSTIPVEGRGGNKSRGCSVSAWDDALSYGVGEDV